jgi:hypothetical protein
MARRRITIEAGRLRAAGDWESEPVPALCDAARAAAALEKLQADLVARARRSGRSWADVGAALGTTRQAAWQRFATPGDRAGDRD